MAKRVTKAETALQEARGRVQEAKNRRDSLRGQMDVAQAVYEAQQDAYDALTRALAREPRKPAPKSTSAPSASKRSPHSKSADELKANSGTGKEIATAADECAVPSCGQPEHCQIHHDGMSPDYHPFQPMIKAKAVGASGELSEKRKK